MHLRYDHPKTQVVPNDQLQVVVTRDVIMHSCCMPPNLVVSGKITNTSDKPIDYVRLHFAFEDKNGKSSTARASTTITPKACPTIRTSRKF